MYCTSCGSPRPDNATVCPGCGTPVQHFPARPPIQNYLVPAILTTLCCCLPFGVVAIIYAAQVNAKLSTGDIPAAMAASQKAKMWCWISVGGGVLVAIAYAVLIGIAEMKL